MDKINKIKEMIKNDTDLIVGGKKGKEKPKEGFESYKEKFEEKIKEGGE